MGKSYSELSRSDIIHLIDRIFDNLAGLFTFKKFTTPRWGLNIEKDFKWLRTDPPSEYPNWIHDIRFNKDDCDKGISEIVEQINTGELPPILTLGPCSSPDDLRQRLLAHGFQTAISFPGMALDLQQLDEKNIETSPLRLPGERSVLEVREVESDADFNDWARVNNIGFQQYFHSSGCDIQVYTHLRGRANSHFVKFYGVWLDGEMVGAAQAVLYPSQFDCKLIELHQCSVIPECRKMGIARQLVSRPLIDAKNEGYVISTIFAAPDAADPFWLSIGYEHYCDLEWFMLAD